MDANKDGKISFSEFVAYTSRQEELLRRMFDEIDTSRTGKVTAAELRAALHRMSIRVDDRRLRRMVQQMAHGAGSGDVDADPEVDFLAFRQFCLLLPARNVRALFEYFHHSSAIDVGEGSAIPPDEKDAVSEPVWVSLAAGAIAGAVSRTATAPIDRIKTMMQIDASRGAPLVARSILASDGALGFWRGNFANVLKIAPESGVKFLAYGLLKARFCEDASSPTTLERFVSGGIAGAIAQAVIYPLETVKTRMALSTGGSEYSSVANTVRRVLQHEGWRGLFGGLGASIAGIIPYAGTDMMVYQTLKDQYSDRNPGADPGPLVFLGCGAVSSVCGQVAEHFNSRPHASV